MTPSPPQELTQSNSLVVVRVPREHEGHVRLDHLHVQPLDGDNLTIQHHIPAGLIGKALIIKAGLHRDAGYHGTGARLYPSGPGYQSDQRGEKEKPAGHVSAECAVVLPNFGLNGRTLL